MATRTVIELIDDITGRPADETVTFGIDGVEYTIDVSKKNAAALRKAFAPWLPHARRVSTRRSRTARGSANGVDSKAVRAWAASNGIELAARGRIPASVLEEYRAAGH